MILKRYLYIFLLITLLCTSIVCCSKKNDPISKKLSLEAGIILNNNTAVRVDPFIFSAKLSQLTRGTRVNILDKSTGKTWVGKSSDYWYKIKLQSGLTGWVFGSTLKKISAKNEDQIVEYLSEFWEEESEKIMITIAGVWWSVNKYGDFTSHCIEFKEDGTYKSYKKNNPGNPIEGEYNFNFNENELVFLNNTSFKTNLNFIKRGRGYILKKDSKPLGIRFKKIHEKKKKEGK